MRQPLHTVTHRYMLGLHRDTALYNTIFSDEKKNGTGEGDAGHEPLHAQKTGEKSKEKKKNLSNSEGDAGTAGTNQP